jgi:prephenate dehydrogenase
MKDKIRIGLIGLGLIGGSIAKALKRCPKSYEIIAFDNDPPTLDTALNKGIIDKAAGSVGADFSLCNVIFLCVPVNFMESVLTSLLPHLNTSCILTDTGSTKGDVIKLIKRLAPQCRFIGGHPLAGSEKSGFEASKENLFENAYYCLTPDSLTTKEDLNVLKSIIADIGAIPFEMSHQDHDIATAAISHVPHIIAALMVNLTDAGYEPELSNIMKTIAAGGFKDITRIASSSPELWTEICFSNKDVILDVLSLFKKELTAFEYNLRKKRKDRVKEFFTSARDTRNAFSERKSLIQKTYDISVDIYDKPGMIAEIATALAKENINIKNIGIIHSRENVEGALEIQFEDEESRSSGLKVLNNAGYTARAK